MNILESIVLGLITGLTEFLPVSSRGHQAILKELFGISVAEPLRDLLIHIAILLAIIVSCGTYIERLRREQKMSVKSGKRRSRHMDNRTAYDFRLIRTAGFPMLLGMLALFYTSSLENNLAVVALCFVINGLIVYIPEHLSHGNKSASQMSAFDSLLIGLFGALSVFPGISRVGAAQSCAVARGADQEKALNWIWVLSIPAIAFLILLDLISIFSVGLGTVTAASVAGYFLAALVAFCSACLGIYLMHFFTIRSVQSAFGFYCWGAGLLSFILYLMA